MPKSARQLFLEKVVPPLEEHLKCPRNYIHHATICLGQKNKEQLGSYAYFCNGPRGERCTLPKGSLLSATRREELQVMLKAFDSAKAAQKRKEGQEKGSATPSKKNLKTIQENDDTGQEICRPLPSPSAIIHNFDLIGSLALSRADVVRIFVYLASNGESFEHFGPLTDGRYCFFSDESLRDITKFPITWWTMYDQAQDKFVSIPTYSHVEVRENEFLIFWRASLSEEDCIELGELKLALARMFERGHLERLLIGTPSTKRKPLTQETVSNQELPSERLYKRPRKMSAAISNDVIDLTV